MEREIMKKLVEWKDSPDRKPLLLTGVRQCGKTYVLIHRELGDIVQGREIVPGKTLLVFDEIQACPNAVTSLKYFCENKRELHIVCAGSLLGVSVRRDGISFPVGKVERLQMYPMTFAEFLCADGGQKLYDGAGLLPLCREMPELYSVPLMKSLTYYYIVGGMPEVVKKWVDTHSFEEVSRLQDNILADDESVLRNMRRRRIYRNWDGFGTAYRNSLQRIIINLYFLM